MVVDTMRAIREEMRQIAVLGVPISATRMIVALTRITVRLFVWSSIDQHELSMYEANFIAEVVDQIAAQRRAPTPSDGSHGIQCIPTTARLFGSVVVHDGLRESASTIHDAHAYPHHGQNDLPL